jgi:MFS family permease
VGQTVLAPDVAVGRRPRAALWPNCDLLLLWSGQAISTVGTQASLLALPLLILATTHSPAQAGLLAAVRVLPYLVVSLPAGVLIDRCDRKRVMILCDAGRALALGSLPLALLSGHLVVAHLYLVGLVEGTLFTVFTLAQAACLPHVVATDHLPAANAGNQAIEATAGLVGPALGGTLYGLGAACPFVAAALSYVTSALSLFFVRATFQEERSAPRSLRVEVREGVTWLWQHPVLRCIALLTGGVNLCGIGSGLIVIVLAQHLHAAPATIGLIVASAGIGGLLGALLAGPLLKRVGVGPIIIAMAGIFVLVWPLYAIVPTLAALGGITALRAVVVPIYMVAHRSYRLAVVPDALQGRVFSVFTLMAWGSQPLGLALTGVLLQAVGPAPTVVVLFAPQLVVWVLASLNPQLRQARLR